MLSLFLVVEVDGRQVPVTLDEILAFLNEGEKRDFKDLIAICREDQWQIQANVGEDEIMDMSDEAILAASERLAENATCFYLIVKDRMKMRLRGLNRTLDFVME